MPTKPWTRTFAEICLIVLIPALAGLVWNRTLLTGAWRGEVRSEAARQTEAQAATGEALPMPIAMAQVKELLDAGQAVAVDARSPQQYRDGHLPGAHLLPVEVARKGKPFPLDARVGRDATVIVYCNGFSCHDSMEVAKLLIAGGYVSVYVYEGGFPEWRDAGHPVAKGGA